MGTAAIWNAERRSRTIYLTGSITPQNEQPQPGNSMNYMPGVESATYHGVYAVPWTTPTSFGVFQVIECRSTSAVFGVYGGQLWGDCWLSISWPCTQWYGVRKCWVSNRPIVAPYSLPLFLLSGQTKLIINRHVTIEMSSFFLAIPPTTTRFFKWYIVMISV